MLSPILETAVEDVKDSFGKELDLMTVDADQEGELAAQYRVSLLPSGIPTSMNLPLSDIKSGHCPSYCHRFQRWEAHFGVPGSNPPIIGRRVHRELVQGPTIAQMCDRLGLERSL
jgi:hypothetical protein